MAQIGRSDDANKAFSAAVQMHDTLVKAWALWGDYLEGLFTRERYELAIKLFDICNPIYLQGFFFYLFERMIFIGTCTWVSVL